MEAGFPVSISVGFTAEEIREFVHEYAVQPFGQKATWLSARGVSWSRVQYQADLARLSARIRELEETNAALGLSGSCAR